MTPVWTGYLGIWWSRPRWWLVMRLPIMQALDPSPVVNFGFLLALYSVSSVTKDMRHDSLCWQLAVPLQLPALVAQDLQLHNLVSEHLWTLWIPFLQVGSGVWSQSPVGHVHHLTSQPDNWSTSQAVNSTSHQSIFKEAVLSCSRSFLRPVPAQTTSHVWFCDPVTAFDGHPKVSRGPQNTTKIQTAYFPGLRIHTHHILIPFSPETTLIVGDALHSLTITIPSTHCCFYLPWLTLGLDHNWTDVFLFICALLLIE